MELNLNMIQTLAVAIAMYYLGVFLKSKIGFLEKFCIPAPVIGGFIFAIANLLLRNTGVLSTNLDVTLQTPFMLVFFTTIGLGASFKMIKQGGKKVVMFSIAAITLVVLQDVIGVIVSKGMGVSPLLGLISGSITMTGGHGTGATWGALFEADYGLEGATAIAMAAATFGLVCGSLIGGPIGKSLIKKGNLKSEEQQTKSKSVTAECEVAATQEGVTYETMFKTISIIFIAMGFGTILEIFFKAVGITLPAYIDAMIVAAIIINFGEQTKKFTINTTCIDIIGNVALNVFLSMALIDLKLWQLQAMAGPLLVMLGTQAVLMAIFAYFITFRLMGKDYDAAVLSSGHCGFGMGATPNGVANMDAITTKFGPSPKAMFVLPVVGAFFVDITNSLIITVFVNLFH